MLLYLQVQIAERLETIQSLIRLARFNKQMASKRLWSVSELASARARQNRNNLFKQFNNEATR
jgi:hypothetical protein